jgi:transcriptional regulator with XRE-family HTH domain
MNGQELKQARLRKRWTQHQAAGRLGVTQAYLSMLEHGRRVMPAGLTRKAAALLDAPATVLPLRYPAGTPITTPLAGSERVRRDLAALGYPGFAHHQHGTRRNPAEVLLHALNEDDLETRASEGLPWLALQYSDLDWDWLVDGVKLRDRQNRLGFVVTLAEQLAERQNASTRRRKLLEYAAVLDRSRLVREDTFCHESLTQAERHWLRVNRPPEAAHWNLLTDMRAETLFQVVVDAST